ncbi:MULTISPECIES: tyrosine-type recombinase/integrase [Mammaliicoccus]|uniref:Tyrosine-type recombinase/integrase n=1 Tax=Mammaliicoccus sciuri TaxID=1296 RepID=A0ABT7I048_MAMSC|nr:MULTISPECIES: tyrosine-type recombinase/integrase [Mammaliicoccus]MCJ0914836.1 tyrosine-type recombinase/integrase [Mammaliicoccus sciuri]MCJ0943469.1 tyrosine-type recombinase/integrase [Mammaliicoccus sciuri]MDL0113428.1 tyrosine-type recombinase/integrase [Mammaliicoccus sciuri]MDL0117785.1 tyrosine-type recombinase/integrase [Mammaliicoccus sciuri]WQJ66247.1 tyrosine-type recombinase/integrase [Mammaliicoccus sciuri]
MQQVSPIKNKDDIRAMYEVLKSHSERDYLLFSLAIHTGMKVNQLLNLTVQDLFDEDNDIKQDWINDEQDLIKVVIPLHLRSSLSNFIYEEGLKRDDFVFMSIKTKKQLSRQQAYRIIHVAAEEVGLKNIGLYSLRKTFAYHAFKSGVSVSIIQKYLGHQSLIETLKFIDVTTIKKETTIELNI